MPPPPEDVSDDDSTGDAIPFESSENGKKKDDVKDDEEASEEEDSDEEGEGIYVVEKIVGHEFKKDVRCPDPCANPAMDSSDLVSGTLPLDQTLEPEENLLEGAKEAVEEYFESIGGRPQPPERPSKKRKSMADPRSTPESTGAKRGRKPKGANGTDTPETGESAPDWVPEGKNWEREVAKVETIIRDPKTGGLMAYLQWQNGRKSRVSIEQCYEKIPMKMLKFYEQHLVFKEA
ncbi:hypothetical protein T310_8239 [Rasamsonia emersonii CBS 393.64]|uniref:Chromo shadow domain-containing protein n=1 Tax=Rasamsonia emersonii (strain ATCC 16479 / CBS 393.64 / IMI 116815) TaxID=1408163 RepID=A0A0F4YHQ3_RASE3|nr:hypothetical protein T310_8239 [Rasamsonia emersonii CBS 393.64]KKA17817.1 hypothetical protein T310_8239 [Rasamsonia emersonii CBS 393.64]